MKVGISGRELLVLAYNIVNSSCIRLPECTVMIKLSDNLLPLHTPTHSVFRRFIAINRSSPSKGNCKGVYDVVSPLM
jgi:hypothetical protein